jgi:hypothetical protein
MSTLARSGGQAYFSGVTKAEIAATRAMDEFASEPMGNVLKIGARGSIRC